MSYDNNNIFAKILRGEAESNVVLENKFVLAFHDIFPKAPVHVLVIPKGSFIDVYDFHKNASRDQILRFYKSINEVVELLDVKEYGFNLLSNCGVNGGQQVFHYHVHILSNKNVN
jgi:diadenosine tetraphosphate (Ap4A) HIT family hydrolase